MTIGEDFATVLGAIKTTAKAAKDKADAIPDLSTYEDVKNKADAAAVRDTVNTALADKASQEALDGVKTMAENAASDLASIQSALTTMLAQAQ